MTKPEKGISRQMMLDLLDHLADNHEWREANEPGSHAEVRDCDCGTSELWQETLRAIQRTWPQ